MAISTFNSTVSARTRTATLILSTPELLAAYEAKGGLAGDLEAIRDSGQNAEILSQAQSSAQAAGGAATIGVLKSFAALQKEYNAVMGVVQAARHDLGEAQAPADVIKAVDKILVNEAEVMLTELLDGDGKAVTDKDGKPKKVARKRVTQEALRAEIARDARALIGLTGAHEKLAQRKVDKPRLEALLASADALSGKLAERSAAKGGQKAATTAVYAAVDAQKAKWGACYRILSALGREEPRVAELLRDAARKRFESKK